MHIEIHDKRNVSLFIKEQEPFILADKNDWFNNLAENDW